MSIILQTAPPFDPNAQVARVDHDPTGDGHRPGSWAPCSGASPSADCYRVGGRAFDTSWLESSWQLVDPELLRHQLFSSVWFEHTQPPLFDLFVGVVLRWSPLPTALTFELARISRWVSC